MSKGKKVLLNIVYSIVGVVLLAATIFHFLAPGVPGEKIGEDGSSIGYLTFPNGEYTGESVLGFLDGTGTFTFKSGEIYEGEWKNHDISGKGKLTSSAGVYDGEYIKSMRSGMGTFAWNDGSKYVGQWANDRMNGEGELITASGWCYKGTFQNDSFYEGTISGVYNENTFKITVSNGMLADKIDVTFSDGVTYTGGFVGKCFSGKGEMTFPGVGKYKGEFEADQRSGDGVFTWNDGAKYDGEWEKDIFNGYGTYTFDATTSITGTFQNGGLNGTYTYKNLDGEFKTVWENGKCTSIKAK